MKKETAANIYGIITGILCGMWYIGDFVDGMFWRGILGIVATVAWHIVHKDLFLLFKVRGRLLWGLCYIFNFSWSFYKFLRDKMSFSHGVGLGVSLGVSVLMGAIIVLVSVLAEKDTKNEPAELAF